MFARLGPWCHDRRKLVLGAVGRRLAARRCGLRRRRRRVPRRVQPARRRVQDRLRHPRRATSAARAPASGRHDRVPRPSRASTTPRSGRRMQNAVRRGRGRSRTSSRVDSPYAEGGAQQIASRGRRRRARSPTPTSSCPTTSTSHGRARSATRSSTTSPQIDGLRIELGGFIFAEFEQPSSEVLGLAFAIVILIVAFGSVLAMGLPVGVALFGIGIGTAHHHAAQQRPDDPRLRHVPRHHDRPRRRHRLRAADRHPLPRAAARAATTCASRSPSRSTPPAARCCSPASPS